MQFRYVKDLYNGDKRMELNVVPAFSVEVSPGLAVIPAARTAADAHAVDREVHVTVTNSTKGAARVSVALQVPAGWRVTPATRRSTSRTRTRRCPRGSGSPRRRTWRSAPTRSARW